MTLDPTIVSAFAPSGKLRASINVGNPVLASMNETGPSGVSVDLAAEFAKRLGTDVDFVVFDAAAKSVEAVVDERADIGFFAVDPARGASIAFSEPYVLIEGFYLVRDGSPVRTNADVDGEHHRVAVGKGSAYDLFLSRELKRARIVRAPTSSAVVRTFLDEGLEVAAGVKQQLQADAADVPGVHLLDERFMVIRQAMGMARSRGADAHAALRAFVEEMKRSGFVADALARHGISGGSVAPPAND